MRGNTLRKGKPGNSGSFTSERVKGEKNNKWVKPIEFECGNCGKRFSLKPWLVRQNTSTTGKRFCRPDCSRAYLRGENHPLYVGGSNTYRGAGWEAARLVAVRRDNGTCQDCKTYIGDSIPVHHIRPFREFRTSQEANRPENLACYCQSCHMKAERLLASHHHSPSFPAVSP